MHPRGASRNKDDHAIFSKAGPYLNSPDETKRPKVIPKMYKLKNKKNNGIPRFKIDIPNKGLVINIAGTKPINALIKAVITRDVIISLIFIGAIKRLVKFLLQISSRKSILKPILVLNKKSYSIAQVKITPTALL